MDVMRLRRSLLMNMIGGGSEMIGQFGRCDVLPIQSTDGNELDIAIPTGITPKLVIINAPNETKEKQNKVMCGVFLFDFNNIGVTYYINTNNVVISYAYTWGSTAANASFRFNDNGVLIIRRITAAALFDVNATYSVEIYS